MPNDWITISPDLNTGKSIAVYVVVFDQAAPFAEDVDTALMAVVDLVPSNSGVAVGSYPHASEIVRVDLVVNELAKTVLVHVDTAGLTMVDFAVNDCGVGARLHLKTGYSVVMDVVRFEITLKITMFPKRVYYKLINEGTKF